MLPSTSDSWSRSFDWPSRLFSGGLFEDAFEGVDLYEAEDAYTLTIDMPGYDRDEMTVSWEDGRLTVAAEHVDDVHDRSKTYHRTFRFPKGVADEEISASYHNGVLEVTLPLETDSEISGREIEIEG